MRPFNLRIGYLLLTVLSLVLSLLGFAGLLQDGGQGENRSLFMGILFLFAGIFFLSCLMQKRK